MFSSPISLTSLNYVGIYSNSAALHGLDDLFDAAMQTSYVNAAMQTSYVNAVQKTVWPAVTAALRWQLSL